MGVYQELRSRPRVRRVASTIRDLMERPGAPDPAPEPERILSAPERILASQVDAHPHLEDGTLVMGEQSYFAPTVRKYKGDTNRAIIGKWCSVAADSTFYVGGMHPTHWITTYGIREMFDLPGAFGDEMPLSHGDIVVGNDCWICERSTILSGIRIGNGAVVATEAVVTKDVEPYTIVAGNPARAIRRRFTEEQAEALQRIAWWDWPLDTVIERVEWLNGRSIDDFISEFG
jgi:acetyltransferase-like isoleucine patch superfamily enzyme